MDRAHPPPARRKPHRGLVRPPSVGIVHPQVGTGFRRVHQYRRTIGDPQPGVLPRSGRVSQDGLGSREQLGFLVRRQPPHEQTLLWQKACRRRFIGQDKCVGRTRTHSDHSSPVLYLAGAVVVITAIGVTQDGTVIRAPTPLAQRGFRYDDQRAAHRLDPNRLSMVATSVVMRSIHPRSLPPPSGIPGSRPPRGRSGCQPNFRWLGTTARRNNLIDHARVPAPTRAGQGWKGGPPPCPSRANGCGCDARPPTSRRARRVLRTFSGAVL